MDRKPLLCKATNEEAKKCVTSFCVDRAAYDVNGLLHLPFFLSEHKMTQQFKKTLPPQKTSFYLQTHLGENLSVSMHARDTDTSVEE